MCPLPDGCAKVGYPKGQRTASAATGIVPLIGPTSIETKSAGWGKIGILDCEQTARTADQVAYRNIDANDPERASYSTFGLVSAGTR